MSRMLSLWHVVLLALATAWHWRVVSPIQGGPILDPAPFNWALVLVLAAVLSIVDGILEGVAAGFQQRLLAGCLALVAWLPMLWAMMIFGRWFPDEWSVGGPDPLPWSHFVTPVCALIAFLILLWAVAAFTASRVALRASTRGPQSVVE